MANTARDRPGVTIHLNDNQSPDPQSLEFQHRGQERYSGLLDNQAGPDSGQTLKFVQGNINSVNSSVVSRALFATGQLQKKGISPVPVNLKQSSVIKICEQCFVCRSLVFCHSCSKCPKCCSQSSCRDQTSKLLDKMVGAGCKPNSSSNPKRGLPPPLSDPTQINKKSHGHKLLCKSPQEQLPGGGIASAYSQKYNRNRTKPKISRLLQPTISSSKTEQKVETYTGSEQTQSFPQGGEIQNGNPGNHPDFPPTRGVGYLNRLQGCLLPHTHTPAVSKISQISCPGSDLPVQSTSLWPLNSSYGVHCNSQGSETDGYQQGYKNPPVPRRLVGESQLPPPLPSTYPKVGPDLSGAGLAGECRKIRTRTQAGLRICRLSIRPPVRTGPTYSGPVASPSREDTDPPVTAGLSGPAIHVLDRPVNSHGKAGSSRSTAYEAHTVAPQKQLEGTRISGENYPITQITAPSLKVVAGGRQCASDLNGYPDIRVPEP